MAWLYLFIASLFEIGWTFCIKYMDVKKIIAIQWLQFFNSTDGIKILGPLLGYIIFGIANIIFFSIAIKQIPMATAMAVWFGTALLGVTIVDILVFKQPYNLMQFLYFAFILIGVVGLKTNNGQIVKIVKGERTEVKSKK